MNKRSYPTQELLPPPEGRTGWPWTIKSNNSGENSEKMDNWPRISIITPSFNQGQFIEETIRSIIYQNYPNLEYIIIDGGSTDNTLEIIEKYSEFISYWVSETDRGQSHAINKGLEKCTGEYVNWICSDDVLCKDALRNIAPLLKSGNDILLLGKGFRIDQDSNIIDAISPSRIRDFDNLVDLKNFWRKGSSILQQSSFFPLKAVRKLNYLNEENHYTMDFELWGKLLSAGIKVVQTDISIGMFRWYPGQKTSRQIEVTHSLTKTARRLILENKETPRLSKLNQLKRIMVYKAIYIYKTFRSKIGIKRRIKAITHA